MEKEFLMTCIKKSDICPDTYEDLFSILGWSFNVLLTGLSPEVD